MNVENEYIREQTYFENKKLILENEFLNKELFLLRKENRLFKIGNRGHDSVIKENSKLTKENENLKEKINNLEKSIMELEVTNYKHNRLFEERKFYDYINEFLTEVKASSRLMQTERVRQNSIWLKIEKTIDSCKDLIFKENKSNEENILHDS